MVQNLRKPVITFAWNITGLPGRFCQSSVSLESWQGLQQSVGGLLACSVYRRSFFVGTLPSPSQPSRFYFTTPSRSLISCSHYLRTLKPVNSVFPVNALYSLSRHKKLLQSGCFFQLRRFCNPSSPKDPSANNSSHSAHPPKPQQQPEDDSSPRRFSGVRALIKRYGFVAIGTYLSVYVITLSGFYCVLSSTLLDVETVTTLVNSFSNYLDKCNLDIFDVEKINPKASIFTVAWLATKVTEPLRLVLSAAITPYVGRYYYKRKAAAAASLLPEENEVDEEKQTHAAMKGLEKQENVSAEHRPGEQQRET